MYLRIMETIVIVFLLLLGLGLVTFGADGVINGASDIAKRFGVSEFVIGLTIVALGTSAPEMVVSFLSAFQGNSDISVGNIIGSNIFNTAIILGLTAVLSPIAITQRNRIYDIPVNVLVTLLLVVFGLSEGKNLTVLDGVIFLSIFVVYFIWNFKREHDERKNETEDVPQASARRPIIMSIFMVLAGLFALVYGGNLFVDNACKIAKLLGVSDKVIAITLIAAGTSLPELATSLVAVIKGKGQLALGNIIGSNTFNILLILGGSAVIRPLSMDHITYWDYGTLMLSAVLLLMYTIFINKQKINKIEGALLLLLGLVYMGLCIAL